jgi:hypothetical protein
LLSNCWSTASPLIMFGSSAPPKPSITTPSPGSAEVQGRESTVHSVSPLNPVTAVVRRLFAMK